MHTSRYDCNHDDEQTPGPSTHTQKGSAAQEWRPTFSLKEPMQDDVACRLFSHFQRRDKKRKRERHFTTSKWTKAIRKKYASYGTHATIALLLQFTVMTRRQKENGKEKKQNKKKERELGIVSCGFASQSEICHKRSKAPFDNERCLCSPYFFFFFFFCHLPHEEREGRWS